MNRFSYFAIVPFLLAGLNGCSATPTPDYTIRVTPATSGQAAVAILPSCPRWSDNDLDFFDNQPQPQFGCADARNLAVMVERPEDLLQGRPSELANGVTSAGSILRYNGNQTRGLIGLSQQPDTVIDATSASTAASSLSGETPPSSGGTSLGK